MDDLCEEMKETLEKSFENFGEMAGLTLDSYFEYGDCLNSKSEVYGDFVEDLLSGKITDPEEIQDWIDLGEQIGGFCAEISSDLEENFDAMGDLLESAAELLPFFADCVHDDTSDNVKD